MQQSNLIMGYSVSQLCHWELNDFRSLIQPLDWFVLEGVRQIIFDDHEGTDDMTDVVQSIMDSKKPQFLFLQSGFGVHSISRLAVEWEGGGMRIIDHEDEPVLIGREGEPLQDHLRKFILDQIGEEAWGITCRLLENMPESERKAIGKRMRNAYRRF